MNVLFFIASFYDYHDITGLEESMTAQGWKAAEIAFDGKYWGLFWVGAKPSKKEIKDRLKKLGFDIKRDGSSVAV